MIQWFHDICELIICDIFSVSFDMYAHIYVNVHLCLRYSRPQRFKAFKNISNATHTLRAEFPPPKTNGPKTHRPSEVPATTECSGFGPKEAKGSWVVKVGEDLSRNLAVFVFSKCPPWNYISSQQTLKTTENGWDWKMILCLLLGTIWAYFFSRHLSFQVL